MVELGDGGAALAASSARPAHLGNPRAPASGRQRDFNIANGFTRDASRDNGVTASMALRAAGRKRTGTFVQKAVQERRCDRLVIKVPDPCHRAR